MSPRGASGDSLVDSDGNASEVAWSHEAHFNFGAGVGVRRRLFPLAEGCLPQRGLVRVVEVKIEVDGALCPFQITMVCSSTMEEMNMRSRKWTTDCVRECCLLSTRPRNKVRAYSTIRRLRMEGGASRMLVLCHLHKCWPMEGDDLRVLRRHHLQKVNG